MAIRAGQYGQLVLTRQTGGAGVVPDVIELFEFRVRRQREFVDITPPDQSAKQHSPSHDMAIVFYRGWIDDLTKSPGTFDTLLPYQAILRPSSRVAAANLTFNCWVRLLEWTVLVGQPNMTSGELISDDEIVLTWA